MCYGASCTPTFTGVTFERCTVVALAGAQVALERPSFKCMGSSSSGVSIYAHGVCTKVVSQGGSISGGTQAVAVQVCHTFQLSCASTSSPDVLSATPEKRDHHYRITAVD